MIDRKQCERLAELLEQAAQVIRDLSAVEGEIDPGNCGKHVAECGFSIRSRRAFRRLGIETLGQLCEKHADQLLDTRNFGIVALKETRSVLKQHGLYLKGETGAG